MLVDYWFSNTEELSTENIDEQSNEHLLRKEKYVQFLIYMMSGSQFYIGKSVKKVHRKLEITNAMFDGVMRGLSSSLKQM